MKPSPSMGGETRKYAPKFSKYSPEDRLPPRASFYDLKGLHNADSVILELDGKELRLPSWMNDRLSTYLTDLRNVPRPEEDAFDCSSFAYHMLGIPEVPILDGTATGWTFREIAGADELEIWDVVMTACLSSATMKFSGQHWMVFLGDGLFLSKFWNGGDLFVSTLSEISKLYPNNGTYRASYDLEMAERKTNRIELRSGFCWGG